MGNNVTRKQSSVIFVAFVLLLVLASGCVGYVFGGSNLGFGGYPSFSGFRPRSPFSRESYIVERYRSEVESYRNEAEEYIENAENDIRSIQEAIDEAIHGVNSVVREYNFFVSSGY